MSITVLKADGRLGNYLFSGLCGLLCVSVIQTSATAGERDSLAEVQTIERSPTDRGPTDRGPTECDSNERVNHSEVTLKTSAGHRWMVQITTDLIRPVAVAELLTRDWRHPCFMLASDVGSIDAFRARDHGIARYNDLREAIGLQRISSFTELTGELSDEFPLDDTLVDASDPINDPDILDFVELRDVHGQLLELGSEAADAQAVSGVRRTSLAARLTSIQAC